MTRAATLLLAASLAAAPAYAASAYAAPAYAGTDPVVAQRGASTITLGQARALLASLPPDSRAAIAADPTALTALLRNTLVQRALLAEAQAKGWERNPAVAVALARAHDEVLLRSYVAAQLPPPAAPTEPAIASAYEVNKTRFMVPRQYHLAQIFVATPAAASPAEIAATRARLASWQITPANFAAQARTHSQDQRSAGAGGDLGWIGEAALVEPIKTAVLGLAEGSVSDVLRTPDGFHLVALIATRPAGPAPLDQVRPAIVQAIQQQQQQAATQAYLDGLLQRDPVRVNEIELGRAMAAAP